MCKTNRKPTTDNKPLRLCAGSPEITVRLIINYKKCQQFVKVLSAVNKHVDTDIRVISTQGENACKMIAFQTCLIYCAGKELWKIRFIFANIKLMGGLPGFHKHHLCNNQTQRNNVIIVWIQVGSHETSEQSPCFIFTQIPISMGNKLL